MRTAFPALAALVLATACTREPTAKQAPAPEGGTSGTAATPPPTAPAKPPTHPGEPPKAEDLPAPPDVAAAPADAEKTKSGLASKVLSKGSGTEHPNPWDEITVHYTGWSTDGKMFDSSVTRGSPMTVPLRAMIKGWQEGVPLMVMGEKRRFWIPEELAYKGNPTRPQGTLVFDVELISFKKGEKPPEAPADVAAAPATAQKLPSGLATLVVKKGTGKDKLTDTGIAKFHFTGWKSDGELIDDSTKRAEPMAAAVSQLPPWLGEGLKLMVTGEKRRLWVPAALLARPGQEPPPYGVTFDVELIEVMNLPAPPDVKAAPADAQKTPSGLASKVLTKGKGTDHPKADSRVKVHYVGWTTDGKMFDTSYKKGQPAEFSLAGVIPGWTEALQLMVVGEKRRFWIPEELAYKGKSGPQGLLVFEIELLEIK
jgi:peptidylprolyl isomerase